MGGKGREVKLGKEEGRPEQAPDERSGEKNKCKGEGGRIRDREGVRGGGKTRKQGRKTKRSGGRRECGRK